MRSRWPAWAGGLGILAATGTLLTTDPEVAASSLQTPDDNAWMTAPAGPPGAVRPFTVAVPDPVLDDLQDRLARTRLPDEMPGVGWGYGASLGYVRELVTYWRDTFDWRSVESRLNELDHFVTEIDGLDVHFIHQRSPNPDAMPLLVTHGWPGSFVEFSKIVGPLTDPAAHGGDAADAFHLVIPSLPGFGFSEAPQEPGYNPERIAEVLASLMERLGYARYGAQGGDWGSIINQRLAIAHPDRLTGLHLNFVTVGPPQGVEDPNAEVTPVELARLQARRAFMNDERGYQGIQGTKPQTLGYGLNDSPAGLAAWIVEKFHGWSDLDGDDVESRFTKDELLTNITVYWVTGSITSSTRIYYENRNVRPSTPMGRIDVPTAGAIFPAEINAPPRSWAEARFNLVQWTEMPRGGHFAALEEPELLVADVRTFFRGLR